MARKRKRRQHNRTSRNSSSQPAAELAETTSADSTSAAQASETSTSPRRWGSLGLGLAALALVAVGATTYAVVRTSGGMPGGQVAPAESTDPLAQRLDRIDRAEAAYLELSGSSIVALKKAARNLELPDVAAIDGFAETVLVRDLDSAPAQADPRSLPGLALEWEQWPVAKAESSVARNELKLWPRFFAAVNQLDYAKFAIETGDFDDEAEQTYRGKAFFKAQGRLQDGRMVEAYARMELAWRKSPSAADDSHDSHESKPAKSNWKLTEWKTTRFELKRLPERMFENVLGAALSPADYQRTREHAHEQIVLELLLGEKKKVPRRHFHHASVDRHPGVSVVDIDSDGFDDLYVTERFTTNMLFRNKGDGTFEEVAKELGLDLHDNTAASIFADFDNDGDPDVFLGRTLEPSLYLVNENGRFVDRSREWVNGHLPTLVSSVNAVDYDGDGLLDVYFSTYASMTARHEFALVEKDKRFAERGLLLGEFLPPPIAKRVFDLNMAADAHRIKNFPGPPNVLLRGTGNGRFEVVRNPGPLEGWRHTYQSTWADIDGDGDQDVYLANDYAPNIMLRNDGAGRFVDATKATGTADIGFGMGASFGDYDRDGRQDLYVTNMFSKAGRRITDLAGDLGKSFAPMAQGNTLFRNLPSGFESVSGHEPPTMLVARAGWGWGGQFVDVDNDGYLDIYTLAGFVTAPPEVAIAEDT